MTISAISAPTPQVQVAQQRQAARASEAQGVEARETSAASQADADQATERRAKASQQVARTASDHGGDSASGQRAGGASQRVDIRV